MTSFRVTVVDPGPDRPNYRLRYRDPVTKRQHWRSAGTANRREADRAAVRWEEELSAGHGAPVANISWAVFCDRYKAEVLPGLAPKTAKGRITVLNHIDELVHPDRLAALTASIISAFAAGLRSRGKSEQSIKSYLKRLHAMLGWAVETGLLAAVPHFPTIRRAKNESAPTRGRALTEGEFTAMLEAIAGVVGERAAPAWSHWIEGLWWSGLRLTESLEVYWDRIDKIRVDLAGEFPVFRIRRELEKGHEDRMLPMAPEFGEFLLRTPEAGRVGPVFRLPPVDGATGTGPRAEPGGTRAPDWAGTICRRIGKAAGIVVDSSPRGGVKYASAHDLRKSFGERWAPRVMPVVLMELMRHKDIKTTMKYYVGLTATKVASIVWEAYRSAGGEVGNGSVFGSAGQFADVSGRWTDDANGYLEKR